MTDSTNAPTPDGAAPESPQDPPESAPQGNDTPGAPESASGESDTFPRSVVEKLRRENASWRDRAKAAESAVDVMRRSEVERAAQAEGLKPAAIWAVTELSDLLSDDGGIDSGKINAAIATARDRLGIGTHTPSTGPGFASGSGVPKVEAPSFQTAFARREK